MKEYNRSRRCKDPDNHTLISVHRDLLGNHDEESFECWCCPFTFCPTCEPKFKLPPEKDQLAELTQ